MRLIATCRTYNEEEHIRDFCESYSEFVDLICIADGGSDDDTRSIAHEFSKVSIRDYPVKVECPKNGMLRNPDGPHIQFLIDWAVEEGADWIVHQDCDQRPNKYLKEDIRDILAVTNKDMICAPQIFLWGTDMWFPKLTLWDSFWAKGLWAWRANIGMKIIDRMPHYEFSFDGSKAIDIPRTGRTLDLDPPYCYMHFGWSTEEKTKAHVEYYRKSGLIPSMSYPLESNGTPTPLREWMVER
jgi:hypothetical protein